MNGIDKTFCLFLDILRTLERMSDEDAGVLFKALAAHANGQEADLTRSEKADLVFQMIADQMDRLKEYRMKKSRSKQEQNGANESKPAQTATPYPYPYPYPSRNNNTREKKTDYDGVTRDLFVQSIKEAK